MGVERHLAGPARGHTCVKGLEVLKGVKEVEWGVEGEM